MAWQDEYESAKRALQELYDNAPDDLERERIERKQRELVQAAMRGVVSQMREKAAEMRALIANLEAVITPNASGIIGDAGRRLAGVLGIWKIATEGMAAPAGTRGGAAGLGAPAAPVRQRAVPILQPRASTRKKPSKKRSKKVAKKTARKASKKRTKKKASRSGGTAKRRVAKKAKKAKKAASRRRRRL